MSCVWRSKVLSNFAKRPRGVITGSEHGDATTLRAACPFSARAESSSTRVPPRDRTSHPRSRASCLALFVVASATFLFLFFSPLFLSRANPLNVRRSFSGYSLSNKFLFNLVTSIYTRALISVTTIGVGKRRYITRGYQTMARWE